MLLVACDYPNKIHYIVENKTNDSIAISYKYKTAYLYDEIKDTLLFMAGNQTDTLFSLHMTSASVFNPELLDTLSHLSVMELVRLNDRAIMKKNIQETKYWSFEKKMRNSANLKLTINRLDFQ